MNIVVVGGGTAGWLTALYAKKIFPEHNVTVIESKQIGVLGAGEASTPHLIQILDFLEIPTSDLIKNTNATVKTTAKFTGWSNNSKDSFYHPFEYYNNTISEQNGYLDKFATDTNIFHLYSYLNNISSDEYCLINKLCNKNLVPFVKTNDFKNINPIQNYTQIGGWSLNFDAKLLAEYFATLAKNRNIKNIDNTIKDVLLNEEGEIYSLLLDDGTSVDCDFVFDCSGFARLIIGKKYLSKWISYKDYLPTNKALPFFLEIDKDKELPPYIEAIAMDYGWMWKTPLQNRYGCGYVYDSNYLSDEDAKKEIENYLGFEPIYPRKDKGAFNFEAGCFESIWIKNCLAIGLSSGFIEPLEATSIMQTIFNLQNFFSNKNNILTKNQQIKDSFNLLNKKSSFSIVEYVYWHYVTNKKNTPFWQDFTKNNKMPDLIKNILNINKERILSTKDFELNNNVHFNPEDFLCVLFGHNLLEKEIINQYENEIKNFSGTHYSLLYSQNQSIKYCVSHSEFLENLKQ